MSGPRAIPAGGRVVVKVGSSSLSHPGGGMHEAAMETVVSQVVASWERSHPTVLVTSGAVAAGLPALGLDRRPTGLADLQVAAAVGQGRLMAHYTALFGRRGLVAGQVLLTKDILTDRGQYLHARQALDRMLARGIVPVVNENDTVVVEELRMGDNDRLAALVSHLVGARLLVILTDADGLFSHDPRRQGAELLEAVRHTDEVLDRLKGRGTSLGSGGVATKVAAARMAAWSGIPTVVASAGDATAVEDALAGRPVGTWVEPEHDRLPARKLWIAFGQPSAGHIRVDAGAVAALVEQGRSLLSVGVTEVDGRFEEGDAVEVLGPGGELVAKGISRWTSAELAAAAGTRHSNEVIHRDDLVVLVRRSRGAGHRVGTGSPPEGA